MLLKTRFRGFLPVVVDLETSGLDCERNAILELAAVFLKLDDNSNLVVESTHTENVLPFEGAKIEPVSLEFLGMRDPYSALRGAKTQAEALKELFLKVDAKKTKYGCTRAILTGHNAHFDLNFLLVAAKRCAIKSPFHSFSTFDTVTLSGIFLQETVLSKAVASAGLEWDASQAHSAIYDAQKTAELFCYFYNNCSIK